MKQMLVVSTFIIMGLIHQLIGSTIFIDEIQKGQKFDNAIIVENYSQWLKNSTSNQVKIKYENCTFYGSTKSHDISDDKDTLKINIGSVVCQNKDSRKYERYQILGNVYFPGYDEDILPVESKWNENKKDYEFILKKGIKVKIKIDLVLNKEVFADGNFFFRGIVYKKNSNMPKVAAKINFLNIQDTNTKGIIKKCGNKKISKSLKASGSYSFKCNNNNEVNDTVMCKLVLFDINEYKKNNCKEPEQIKISKVFAIKLGNSKKEQFINFQNGYFMKYKYFLEKL